MNDPTPSRDLCRNPSCTRQAEPSDAFCCAWGLERFLYERDARPRPELASARRTEGEPRR